VEDELEARCCWRMAPAHCRLSKLRSGMIARRDAIVGWARSRETIGVLGSVRGWLDVGVHA
jgi:hypothetical protein